MLSPEAQKTVRLFLIDQVLNAWKAEGIKTSKANDRRILSPQKVINTYNAWHNLISDKEAVMTIHVIHGDIMGTYKFYRGKSKPIKKRPKTYGREVGERIQRAFDVGRKRISRYEPVKAAYERNADGIKGRKLRSPSRRKKPLVRYQKQALGYGLKTLKPVDTHYTRRGHWVSMKDKRSLQDEKGRWKTYTKIPGFMVEKNVRESFMGAFVQYAHLFQ